MTTATATATRIAKKQLVKISTKKTLHFVHILAVVAQLRHETKHKFFPNLDTVLSNLTQENFTNIGHIKERQN